MLALCALMLTAQAPVLNDPDPCPTCSAFPPYQHLDCSASAKREGGGFCLDVHPAQSYCDMKAWIVLHPPSTRDYDFAVRAEQIMRPVFGSLTCSAGKETS